MNGMKAVIFDMDGVIIDSESIYLQYDLEFAKKKNPDVKPEQLFGMVGAAKMDAWMVMEEAVHNGQTWEELRNEFRTLNIYSDIDYREIFRPEVKSVLKVLKEQHYKLALASSTQMDIIMRVLEENEIKDYFDVIVSGNQFKKSKPDPEIYHYTARALQVKEEECLVIEDSTIGITAASRAGMKIAAILDTRFGFDRSLSDYQIQNVADVLDILLKK